ncbi:MAG: site-specific integrase [Microlunatus sp.]
MQRAVVLAPQLVALLDAERRRRLAGTFGTGWRAGLDPGTPWVFPRTHGTGPASPAMIGRRAKLAMDGAATTHQLRHRYASRLYAHTGHNLMLVKDQMGHASVSTTQIYVAIDPADALPAVSTIAGESSGTGARPRS